MLLGASLLGLTLLTGCPQTPTQIPPQSQPQPSESRELLPFTGADAQIAHELSYDEELASDTIEHPNAQELRARAKAWALSNLQFIRDYERTARAKHTIIDRNTPGISTNAPMDHHDLVTYRTWLDYRAAVFRSIDSLRALK
ncbi:hypothetical protein GCM10022409_35060 [Hymenobacter glaciei]|uniref:Uncharacterized protein n=1 Tax=Hymenobacter glaciei TaxID=877209 RepID=A0ABP7UKH5_9BACT